MARLKRYSKHFHQVEFLSRDGAPMPVGKSRELERLVMELLEAGRQEFGRCTVVSGHRSASHNSRVGGARDSYHLHTPGRRGAAADLQFAGGTPAQWYAFFDRIGAGGVGRYSTFVHVDNRSGRARW